MQGVGGDVCHLVAVIHAEADEPDDVAVGIAEDELAALVDNGKASAVLSKSVTARNGKTVIKAKYEVENVRQWSAETPELYNLVIGLKKGKKTLSAKAIRVGFKKVEIKG